jgi:F-type H+-transporting ATPase subunit a
MIFAATVPLNAEPIFPGDSVPFMAWLTNSIAVTAIVILVITLFARRATAQMKVVPEGRQNFFEALVETLYNLLEGIVGRHMIGKTFSFLASLFIFIITANWFGLLPGVGSIGWGEGGGFFSTNVTEPLLRPATADLNMTLGLAALAMVLWLVWSLQEVGLGGILHHIFGPKGGMTGLMGKILVPVFFVIGILEVVSIATRPVSLSLRLFGNIYAGENILTMMIGIGHEFHLPDWATYVLSIIVPIPFYFLELMVGLLQAFVFMLLCAVYIQLSTSHEEEAH